MVYLKLIITLSKLFMEYTSLILMCNFTTYFFPIHFYCMGIEIIEYPLKSIHFIYFAIDNHQYYHNYYHLFVGSPNEKG